MLFKHCRFAGELTEGYGKESGDLRISGEFIQEIGEKLEPEEGEEVKDLSGKFLLPGLIDLHTHFAQWSDTSNYELLTLDPAEAAFRYYRHAMAFAAQGYTTVRDVGSDFRSANALSRAIRNGWIDGPRVFSCGLIVTPTETGNQSFTGMYHEADGSEEITKACREEYKKGASFIKIMASGSFLNDGGVPSQPIVTPEELKAAVAVSQQKDGYVAAHVHSRDAIRMAVETGVRTLEHGSFMDDICIRELKESGSSFVVPTLSTIIFYDNNDSSSGFIRAASHKLNMKLQSFENLRAGCEAGLKYGWGTDIPLDSWEKNPGLEFRMRKKYFGCSNTELLKQATIYSAEAIGIDSLTGSVCAGKYADLIVVDQDPRESLEVMFRKPLIVFCRGKRLF